MPINRHAVTTATARLTWAGREYDIVIESLHTFSNPRGLGPDRVQLSGVLRPVLVLKDAEVTLGGPWTPAAPTCECGAGKVGGIHSNWCAMAGVTK